MAHLVAVVAAGSVTSRAVLHVWRNEEGKQAAYFFCALFLLWAIGLLAGIHLASEALAEAMAGL